MIVLGSCHVLSVPHQVHGGAWLSASYWLHGVGDSRFICVGAVRTTSVSIVTLNSLLWPSTYLIISFNRNLESSVLFCRYVENSAIVQELQVRCPLIDKLLCHAFLGSCSENFQVGNGPIPDQVRLQICTEREWMGWRYLAYSIKFFAIPGLSI